MRENFVLIHYYNGIDRVLEVEKLFFGFASLDIYDFQLSKIISYDDLSFR